MLCITVALAGTVAAAPAPRDSGSGKKLPTTQPVYLEGRVMEFTFVPGKRVFPIGPWKIPAKLERDKPRDPRPNLYIFAPGTQYTAEFAPQYNHNEIISALPVKAEPRDWDIYWAIVLDPAFKDDIQGEQQLVLATQQGFEIPEGLAFEDIPGATFLREFLKIQGLEGLDKYRRPDGALPRVIIVPAHLSIRAAASDPSAPPPAKRSLATALSSILRRQKPAEKPAQSGKQP
ncbi:MAG TPA: hypothetical protein VD837_18730 [Terriglobales bacterium]|nr:hypothetical protein [Terriglobales bacterium]